MFLKRLRISSKRIGFRLSLAYLLIFTVSSSCLFVTLYFLLNHSLSFKDQELLESSAGRYALIYKSSGLDGIKREIEINTPRLQRDEFLVHLSASDRSTLYFHAPSDVDEYDLARVKEILQTTPISQRTMRINSLRDQEDAIDILQERLPDGNILQIGNNTEDLERFFDGFREAFIIITFPWLLLGGIGAWLFSRRTLRPIRDLIATIRLIQSGSPDARVKTSKSGDELDELGQLFNGMLEKNTSLVRSMHESLDFVSHDLRTPMTRFRGLAEVGLASKHESQKNDALAEGIQASREILTLLNIIMDISEAEAGAMRLHLQDVQVIDLLESVQDLYCVIAEERKISVHVVAQPIVIKIDQRLKQAVANLLDNALKYAPPHSVVEVRAFYENEKVVIQVQDSGPGIDPAEKSRIWDRLYRGDRSRSTHGMGLGLSLVKSIVKAHGGSVRVESVQGKGSTFSICLPSSSGLTLNICN